MDHTPGRFGPRFGSAAAACLTLLLMCGVSGAFSPARTFPDTSDGVHVFVDQLPGGLSTAQKQFAASHYAGTQKQTSGLIDAIRAYNPDFIMIQYRLAVRESDAAFIHRDTWTNDWAVVDAHEDWFVHDNQGNRVYQLYAGWLEEYCMDISGRINGNQGNGWKEYVASEMIIDAQASHADGIFGDSTHLPYAVPSSLWDSPIGGPPHVNYIDDMEDFYDYVYPTLSAANTYWIPNIGGLCTTLDTTTGYYQDVHGAMVEGFGTKLSNYDWKLQQNRTLNLIRNGKIYIAQNGVGSPSNTAGRVWLLSNYLLLKHDKSFVNILASGVSQMHWWPEYDLDIGQAVDPDTPDDIDELKDASGVYVRRFTKGMVLVNPNGSPRTFTLDPLDPHWLVIPRGGGEILPDGSLADPGGLDLVLQGGSITLGAWSAAVLVPEPTALALLGVGLAALIRRRGR